MDNKEFMSKPILGTYEGECADANITNLNGLDITKEVWDNVFASEDYKKAIDRGWYIGFLGHPEDPNCMDFEHACIVMTEGHIDNNGKVYGKFNLIDTPVGKIVKAFQDAGVVFGISVRGAGDIVNNSVDPDTFVFRGFDLVTFPAFPESIPEFIAASTDANKRAKYKILCSEVQKSASLLNKEEVETIQECFASQSDEYRILDARKQELLDRAVDQQKHDGVMDLYLEAVEENKQLKASQTDASKAVSAVESAARRKIDAMNRIMSAQIRDLGRALASTRLENKHLKDTNSKLKVEASKRDDQNLLYIQKAQRDATSAKRESIEAKKSLRSKDSVIASLKSQLSETVDQVRTEENKSSNLDAKIKKLQSRIEASEKLLAEYQNAYASLYASAVGANVESIEASTHISVKELQSLIKRADYGTQPVMSSVSIESLSDDEGLVTL